MRSGELRTMRVDVDSATLHVDGRTSTVTLTVEALHHTAPREALFDESRNGLAFLRAAIVQAIGSGDGILANSAVYALANLACHTQEAAHAEDLAVALRGAKDDVRIGVAHGAAFVANYLQERKEDIAGQLLEAAKYVGNERADDPLAIVRRQAEFGAKKGAREREKRTPDRTEGSAPA